MNIFFSFSRYLKSACTIVIRWFGVIFKIFFCTHRYLTFEQVTDPELLVDYPATQHSHGLLSSALGLRVPVGRSMQVRCTARVAPAWREGSEAVVGSSHMTDSKEAMLLGEYRVTSWVFISIPTIFISCSPVNNVCCSGHETQASKWKSDSSYRFCS